MNHALILNVVIALIVLVALAITRQPVVLLGLLMLQDMPYGLLQQEESEEEGKPMGFVHHEEK